MAGLDDQTGKVLGGFAHVVQSLGIIFTTSLRSRVMRRTFGSLNPAVLGRSMTPPVILRWKTALIIAIELWEPRYRADFVYDTGQDTSADVRAGQLSFVISGAYLPRGHLGDPTPEGGIQTVSVGQRTGGPGLAVR